MLASPNVSCDFPLTLEDQVQSSSHFKSLCIGRSSVKIYIVIEHYYEVILGEANRATLFDLE